MNVANFQLFVKIFKQKFLTRDVRCARAVSSSTKSSKIAICENLDPRKFSAIWYTLHKLVALQSLKSGRVIALDQDSGKCLPIQDCHPGTYR